MRRELARRFRSLLSGSPTGVPDWTPLVAGGDDLGPYMPDDAPWVVHADLATMIGGIRALLMQALHPGSLAGVVQHSRYEQDVLGRLNGTIRWLTISTFGSHTAITDEAARVRAMHERVRGRYDATDGERAYKASDPDLLTWVHVAFTDSFLAAHAIYGRRPVNPDDYVRDWAKAVLPLGCKVVPTSQHDLQQLIEEYAPHLRVDEVTLRVVSFIRRVPFPLGAKPVYWWLFQAAVDSLNEEHRRMLGLRTLPRPLVRIVVRAILHVMQWIVGDASPMEKAALERQARLRRQ